MGEHHQPKIAHIGSESSKEGEHERGYSHHRTTTHSVPKQILIILNLAGYYLKVSLVAFDIQNNDL